MTIRISAAVALAALALAVPANALIVWKGRDGKAYASVKDCFTNNPQCLPEQGRVAAGGGGKSDAGAPASRSSERTATRAMCTAADGWMHPMPCGKGEVPGPVPE